MLKTVKNRLGTWFSLLEKFQARRALEARGRATWTFLRGARRTPFHQNPMICGTSIDWCAGGSRR